MEEETISKLEERIKKLEAQSHEHKDTGSGTTARRDTSTADEMLINGEAYTSPEQWLKELLPLAEKITKIEPLYGTQMGNYCCYCSSKYVASSVGNKWQVQHQPDCAWVMLSALIRRHANQKL